MRRLMRWVGLLVLIVSGFVVGLFVVSRAMGPNDEHRAALAWLDDEPAPPGRNAFAALWLIEYDVPPEQVESVVAADVENYRQALNGAGSSQVLSNLTSVAEGRFPRHSSRPSGPQHCGSASQSCLAIVRAQRDEVAPQIGHDRVIVERVRGLSAFDHYRSPMRGHTFAPLPALRWIFVSPAASALDFVEGRQQAALEAVCRDVETWRRLSTQGDSLVFATMGGAMVAVGSRLFADMLAELPLDHPLPPVCSTAFDPSHVAPDLCSAMRGEEQTVHAHLERYGQEAYRFLRPLVLDVPATRAMMAPVYGHACAAPVRRALADGGDIPPVPGMPASRQWRCISNLLGCSMAPMTVATYTPYLRRSQDIHAMMRAVDHALRLRAEAGARREMVIQSQGESVQWSDAKTGAAPVVDATTDEIWIPLREPSRPTQWRIPLPGSRWTPPSQAE